MKIKMAAAKCVSGGFSDTPPETALPILGVRQLPKVVKIFYEMYARLRKHFQSPWSQALLIGPISKLPRQGIYG
jgi:hypothetical protein